MYISRKFIKEKSNLIKKAIAGSVVLAGGGYGIYKTPGTKERIENIKNYYSNNVKNTETESLARLNQANQDSSKDDSIINNIEDINKDIYINVFRIIGGLGAAVTAAAIIKEVMRVRKISKCENYNDEFDRMKCYEYVNENISKQLKNHIKQCDKSKNPEKCREMVNIRINTINEKIRNIKGKLNDYNR